MGVVDHADDALFHEECPHSIALARQNADGVLMEDMASRDRWGNDAIQWAQCVCIEVSDLAAFVIPGVDVSQLHPQNGSLDAIQTGVVAQHFIAIAQERAMDSEFATEVC